MAGYVINEDMDYAEAGRKLIKEHPELLERWFGQGGTFQTGGITNAEGEGKAKQMVMDALGI